MEIVIDQSFIRDVKKAPLHIQKLIPGLIQTIRDAQKITDISKVKKLSGSKNGYRIKIEDYRLGFYSEPQKVIVLSRLLARKDIYKFFP